MIEHENEYGLTGYQKWTIQTDMCRKQTVYGKSKRKYTDPYITQSSNKPDMSTWKQ